MDRKNVLDKLGRKIRTYCQWISLSFVSHDGIRDAKIQSQQMVIVKLWLKVFQYSILDPGMSPSRNQQRQEMGKRRQMESHAYLKAVLLRHVARRGPWRALMALLQTSPPLMPMCYHVLWRNHADACVAYVCDVCVCVRFVHTNMRMCMIIACSVHVSMMCIYDTECSAEFRTFTS